MEREAVFIWRDGAWDKFKVKCANGLNSALPDKYRRAGGDAVQRDFYLAGFMTGCPVYAENGTV